MSDRLAVMSRGRIAQVGAPREVYETPANAYVADFLGVANLLAVECSNGCARVIGTSLTFTGAPDGSTRAVVRPERLVVTAGGPALVEEVVYAGATTLVRLRLGDVLLQALVANDGRVLPGRGDTVAVEVPADAVRYLSE